MKPIIVAFYTKATPYEQIVEELRASVEALGLDHDIQGYYNRGSWVANCGIKPEFLKEMLVKHPDRDLLYVDADAIIRRTPELEGLDCHIGVHYLYHPSTDHHELLSGTIFLRNCPTTRRLMQLWINAQEETPNVWDQKVLQRLLEQHPEFKVHKLPGEYTKIFDKQMGDKEPIVEHFQASRQNRSRITPDAESSSYIIPNIVDGQRTRIGADGSFALPRCSRATQKRLDQEYVRCPNELRWFPKSAGGMSVASLQQFFDGKKCYYVGKGPSLDYLTKEHFEDTEAPVICINDSVYKIEALGLPNQLFVMQQDAALHGRCKPSLDDTILIITQLCKNWYPEIVNKVILTTAHAAITVVKAIELARELGSVSGILMAFDACTTKQLDYADCIGYPSKKGGAPERFLMHRRKIEQATVGYHIEWVTPQATPTAPGYKGADNTQQ